MTTPINLADLSSITRHYLSQEFPLSKQLKVPEKIYRTPDATDREIIDKWKADMKDGSEVVIPVDQSLMHLLPAAQRRNIDMLHLALRAARELRQEGVPNLGTIEVNIPYVQSYNPSHAVIQVPRIMLLRVEIDPDTGRVVERTGRADRLSGGILPDRGASLPNSINLDGYPLTSKYPEVFRAYPYPWSRSNGPVHMLNQK